MSQRLVAVGLNTALIGKLDACWGVTEHLTHGVRIKVSEIVKKPMTDPTWVVQDVMPRGSLAILAGEAGAGKSSLCYHLAMCVALGIPFLARYPVTQTHVLYIDQENGLPDAERYWQRVWLGLACPDISSLDEYLRMEHFSLGANWAAEMRDVVQDFRPGLIIIDTATPSLQIQDENDNAEAARKIAALRVIQVAACNDAAMIVLKHEKIRDDKTHRRTIRGAKTWLGQVDIVMYHYFKRGGSGKLRRTYLVADKPRAFGLDHTIEIIPSWTQPDEPRGLILNAQRAMDDDENDQ